MSGLRSRPVLRRCMEGRALLSTQPGLLALARCTEARAA
jgi:hypothetical protein